MKQALFILAAFLLLAPSILMGQDFEVVSPTNDSLNIHVIGKRSPSDVDSFIVLKNNLDKPITIFYEKQSSSFWRVGSKDKGTILINAKEEKALKVVYAPSGGYGTRKSNLSLTDSVTSYTILCYGLSEPYMIDGATNSILISANISRVNIGSTDCFPVRARNTTNEPILIHKMTVDGDSNIIVSSQVSFPYVLLPGEDTVITSICYTAEIPNGSASSDIKFHNSIDEANSPSRPYSWLEVSAFSVQDTILLKPCITVGVSPTVIGPPILSDTSNFSIHLKSNRYTSQTIQNISFDYNTDNAFTIQDVTFPITLDSLEELELIGVFTPTVKNKDKYGVSLNVKPTDCSIDPIPIAGLHTTSSVTESSDPSVSLTLSPNPATTSVIVSIKGAGQIEGGTMTDELGKTIYDYNHPQLPEWKWELKPDRVSRGTYFVRINGKTPEGKPFVITKRLVVQ